MRWTDNNIGVEGATKISESLRINTTLTELNLYCKQLKNKIIWRIMNKWTDNNIGVEGANKISEALMINSTLTKLNLSRT